MSHCHAGNEVLARHFNARIQVFSCLRSVGQRYCDGVNHDENRLIPAAPSSWSVELSSTWTRAQHVCNNPGPDVRWYLSSHVCCTPSGEELCQLTTLVTFAYYTGSDRNSCRIWRQLGSGRRTSQLVNILELASLLTYLRPLPARDEISSCRMFLVLGSLVEASLAARDRSSCFFVFDPSVPPIDVD